MLTATRLSVCLILTLISGCQSIAVSECSWAEIIWLDEGYEHRLTRSEKEQVLQNNENVERYCR